MDIPYGDERLKSFITNVGLITTNGPIGYNIMASEWTHMLSFKPCLIATCQSRNNATYENLKASMEFGVGITTINQAFIASIVGNSNGKEINKIEVLKELGVEFYKAKNIDVWMVKGCAFNAECKVVRVAEIGDHPIFIGEVLEVSINEAESLAYHKGKYWELNSPLPKPEPEFKKKIEELLVKYRKADL